MWAQQLTGPRCLEPVEVDPPDQPADDGAVLTLAFRAGAVCGTDLACYSGLRSSVSPSHAAPGYPLHEIVGTVVNPGGTDFAIGRRVVGWARHLRGLAELVLADAGSLIAVDDGLGDVEATTIQPLACVLFALSRVDVRGKDVAIIGLGPFGLLFAHAAAVQGAASVTGVDPVDRRAEAPRFGVDRFVWGHSREWARDLSPADAPDVVIEAVGHQTGTLRDAVLAVRPGGTVYGFGVPDDAHYAIPYEVLFRKRVTLTGGPTQERGRFLARAAQHLRDHPELPARFLTHRFDVSQAQQAYQVAARPAPGRLKVALAIQRPGQEYDA